MALAVEVALEPNPVAAEDGRICALFQLLWNRTQHTYIIIYVLYTSYTARPVQCVDLDLYAITSYQYAYIFIAIVITRLCYRCTFSVREAARVAYLQCVRAHV